MVNRHDRSKTTLTAGEPTLGSPAKYSPPLRSWMRSSASWSIRSTCSSRVVLRRSSARMVNHSGVMTRLDKRST